MSFILRVIIKQKVAPVLHVLIGHSSRILAENVPRQP